MPGGDRTGPTGQGPMTGRAAGYCSGYSVPGFLNPVPGRGFYGAGRGGFPGGGGRGRAWGGGRGMRLRTPFYGAAPVNNPYAYSGQPYTPPSREEEISYLNEQRSILEEELESLKKRIKELESEKK